MAAGQAEPVDSWDRFTCVGRPCLGYHSCRDALNRPVDSFGQQRRANGAPRVRRRRWHVSTSYQACTSHCRFGRFPDATAL